MMEHDVKPDGEAYFQPRNVYACLIVHSRILQVRLAHLEFTTIIDCVQSLISNHFSLLLTTTKLFKIIST